MAASVNVEASIHSLRALALENDWLQVSILPDLGAKLYDLIWKPTGRNFLWHNARIPPQVYPLEANFDNYWCGGWDDGFPTCEACVFAGESYPNLGELRSLHWKLEAAGSGAQAYAQLSAFGPISPVRAEKTVSLSGTAPVLRIRYAITHLGHLPLDFMWGTHPALEPAPQMLLRIPVQRGIVGLASDPRLGTPGQEYVWPILETPAGRTDMSRVPGRDAKVYGGHYLTDLAAGWYAVEDGTSGQGFLLAFPADLCPYLWLWLVYGGWRGHYHVAVEPWTSYPVNLAEAVRQKTHRRLDPGQEFSIEIGCTIYTPPETWREALKRVAGPEPKE